MGRLLERLLSDAESAPAATPATLATLPGPSPRKVAESQESQGVAPAKTREQRAHLLALAADEWLPAGLVHGLGDADVTACAGLPDETLRAYLHALEKAARMDAGMVPVDYSQAALCEGCGPVWLWQGAPARLKGCPWCFRRKVGKGFARPLVTCGACRHFLPDTINPAAGGGACGLGLPNRRGEAGRWPMTRRECGDYRPRPEPETGEKAGLA